MPLRPGQSTRRHDPIAIPRAPSQLATFAALGVGLALTALSPSDARACGACYSQTSESTVVSDHRMALSISQERTILWDQIRYQGSPSEFAYVVPIRPGSYLEASNDAWFTALDAATRPIVMQPQVAGRGGSGGRARNVGCGGARSVSGCSADTYAAEASGEAADEPVAPPPVEIVNQEVVGPYESVTLRSRDPLELDAWLTEHGFTVPAASKPVIADFVAGGLDFIALRLRPGKSVRAMQPIRIVSPGADATMPLRMMKIGAGNRLGITLWVLAEGRYRAGRGFTNVAVEPDKISWDFTSNRSTYQELSRSAMATDGGRGVLTEYADRPGFAFTGRAAPQAGMTQNVGVADAYAAACTAASTPVQTWTARAFPQVDRASPDGGADAAEAEVDAGDDAATDLDPTDAGPEQDAGEDASTQPEGDAGAEADVDGGDSDAGATAKPARPASCDDLSAALHDLQQGDVWITRLRMDLPYDVLDETLRLEADPTQKRVENIHTARDLRALSQLSVSRRAAPESYGTYLLVGATALAVARILERRRPRR
ncbi:MAG: DUF2330 domain-containing protein [Polyangiaceae bacterium]